ncbi:MAG: twin-arginine translocation pathway signal, partial [Bacteroidota bacterium]
KFGGRRLVVIQLSGGNDGLNTVVPFRNDILYEARPQLLAKPSELLKVSDELAFNPEMEGFRSLFDEGDVCVLNSVGYPNPNRSHFRSMDIWHTASDAGKYSSTGWLGRYLDHECTANTNVTSIEIGQVLSLALKGAEFKGTPVANINQFYNASRKVAAGSYDGQNETASFLYKTVLDIKSTASYLY